MGLLDKVGRLALCPHEFVLEMAKLLVTKIQAGWNTDKVEEISKKLSQLEKGAEATVTAQGDVDHTYPAIKVDAGEIVDTNGAGDGFCGGFMGLYAQGVEDPARCVKVGHYLANMIVIKRVGSTCPPMAERTNIPSFKF
ncbi:hypothetical protein MBANPS3_004220 [Mucor bainieri]